MDKKMILILIVLLFSSTIFSQKPISKRDLKEVYRIYNVAIDSFLTSTPAHIVLIDSTNNRRIEEFDFADHVNYLLHTKNSEIDSSWISFLKNTDEKKAALSKIKLDPIKSIHTIRLFNRDTFFAIQTKKLQVGRGVVEPYGWVDGWATISTPIFSKNKNKAIVEISYITSTLSGHGGIFFLEKKRNGQWVIVQYLQSWVS